MSSSSYHLLTSTRYDPALRQWHWNNSNGGACPIFLADLHRERLESAANTHNWPLASAAVQKLNLAQACVDKIDASGISKDDAYKIRITISEEGELTIALSPLPSSFPEDPSVLSLSGTTITPGGLSEHPTQIFIDCKATTPSILTRTKTTHRMVYEAAKERNSSASQNVPSNSSSDILLYNTDHQIMETTIFNIAFQRQSRWLTPSTSSGCLPGVVRRWLLDSGRISEDKEGILEKESIKDGEVVLLFNGVQGCRLGVIVR